MKRLNLTNQTFGNLTALYRIEKKPKRSYWHCRCSCGREVDVAQYNLTSGHTKSCGHLVNGRKRRDITNQRFGNLTALYPLESQKKGRTVWRCRCDCGKEVDRTLNALRKGGQSSCGCKRRVMGEDLTGRKIGRWTVLKKSEKKTNGKYKHWICQCECGTVKEVATTSLKYGGSFSCGCAILEYRDFSGEKRGGLTALKPTGNIIGNSPEYIWRCECGKEVILPVSAVPRLGNRKCPDCDKALRRGLTVDMRQRLENVAIHGLAPRSLRNLEQGKLRSNNTSGIRGVYEKRKRWVAVGHKNGKRVHLGTFDTMEEAKEARESFILKQYGDAFRILDKREGENS